MGRGWAALRVARASLVSARASLGDARASLDDARASLGAARTRLSVARMGLSRARMGLGDAPGSLGNIVSPRDRDRCPASMFFSVCAAQRSALAPVLFRAILKLTVLICARLSHRFVPPMGFSCAKAAIGGAAVSGIGATDLALPFP